MPHRPLLERTIAFYRTQASSSVRRDAPLPAHALAARMSQLALQDPSCVLARWTASGIAMCEFHRPRYAPEKVIQGALPMADLFFEMRAPLDLPIGPAAALFLCSMGRVSRIEQALRSYPQHVPPTDLARVQRLGLTPPSVSWKMAIIDQKGHAYWEWLLHVNGQGTASLQPASGFACPLHRCTRVLTAHGEPSWTPCSACVQTICHILSWLQTGAHLLAGHFQQEAPSPSDVSAIASLGEDCGERLIPRADKLHKLRTQQVRSSYRVMSFDASLKKGPAGKPLVPQGSWLERTQAIDPQAIVKVQRQFGEATRRLQGDYWRRAIEAHTPKGQEPDLERGIVIPVAPHERLISMRAHESRRLIKRVIASAFRQEK